MISYYCERVSFDFFGEPFNAITNIFFILSAILILKIYKDYIFFFSISFIGISSFTFHTYPNSITGLLDVIAIVIFMLVFITKIYKQLFRFKFLNSTLIAILFVVVCYFSGMFLQDSIFGFSSYYFPIILHLVFLIIYLNKKKVSFLKKYIKDFDKLNIKSNPMAAIIIPDKDIIPGAETLSPAFIVFENYEVILKWNRSLRFALAVCTLKEKFKDEI